MHLAYPVAACPASNSGARVIIATVDPGIDTVGIGVWKTEYARAGGLDDSSGWYGAAHALADLRSVKSRKDDESIVRSRTIGRGIAQVVNSFDVQEVYIEIPPLWHAARQKGRRTTAQLFEALFKLNRSIGAIAAALPVEVKLHEIAASRLPHEFRFDTATKALLKAGKNEPRNDDERSAAWIGLEVVAAIREGYTYSSAVKVRA